ncbi:MAG TPA: ABC transporter ATP-binding protein [Gemmataceae bacterium]|jgi:putative ABC transport system ATP-binding protein|nr:ABC transporter ATP-binding protein [Gemmataceae bacterium]
MHGLLKWFRFGPDAPPASPRANKRVLRARGVTHSFGEGEARVTALHPLALDLYRGQVALLMGPSGSGKSTLLAALSGLLRPDGGQVLVLGKDLWALSAKEQEQFRLRHFGFIFQGYNLFPALTARQQLEMILRWGEGASGGEARRRTDEMLATLGLGNKGHLRPAQLSGGEKQRVAIGRALIKGPDFCFADEPTSALDWEHGQQVIEMLRDAARERGATVLVVSHDARLVPYADRVFHLDDGHLTEQTAEVFPLRHAEELPAAV